MRFYETRQFDMLQFVTKLLKDNKDDLSSKVPALRTILTDFLEKQDVLNKFVFSNQNIVKTGTLEKKSIRDGLTDTVLKLVGVLRAHHFQNKDMSQASKAKAAGAKPVPAKMNYTFSGLNRLKSEELYRVSQQVINAVKKIKYLEQYGITSGDIKEAEAYLKEFASNKEGPKQRRKETASRNKKVTLGIKESRLILENTIDPLVRIATKDNPELYFKYKNCRKVLPRGQGRPSDKEASYRESRKRKGGESRQGEAE